MQRAGRVVATVLAEIEETRAPGQTTKRVDDIAARTVARLGAKASFKGLYGFPASICISINEEIVHGIPSPGRVLKEGDIVSLDFGAYLDGLHADAAVTLPVGKVSEEARRLLSCCQTALERGTAQARPGKPLGDLRRA